MSNTLSFHAVVRGRVQGVFFRASVESQALRLGLTGFVRNQRDGSVEVLAEGGREALMKLAAFLREGPPAARVDAVQISWGDAKGEYKDFRVR